MEILFSKVKVDIPLLVKFTPLGSGKQWASVSRRSGIILARFAFSQVLRAKHSCVRPTDRQSRYEVHVERQGETEGDRAGERKQRGGRRSGWGKVCFERKTPQSAATHTQPLVMEHSRSFRRWQERLGDFLSRCEGSAVTDVD